MLIISIVDDFRSDITALLMKRNSKDRDYIGWSSMLLLFLCLETVTSCLFVHMHLLNFQKTRLGDHCFNCKQVNDVYYITINSTSL